MDKNELEYKKISNTILKRYIPAVILIVALVISRQLIIQYEINQDDHLSRIVNIAGRQRMLSQKISKDAYALYLSEDKSKISFYLDELKTSADIWEKSNIDLKKGNQSEGIEVNNSDKIKELFSEIEGNHQEMLSASYSIINMIESGNYSRSLLLDKVNVVESNEAIFLEGMDKIVFQYDMESEDKIKFIGKTEQFLFFCILIIVLFEVLYIFRPAAKSLVKAFEEIKESNENMMILFKTAHGALFLVDEETSKVLLMNKEAEGLVNTDDTDKKCINIKDFIHNEATDYSDVIERIKTNEKNENIELVINVNEKKNINTLLSSIKIHFHKKVAILVGLFDITAQKQAEETLKNKAITDELTGLYNRHFLDKSINENMESSDLNNQPISMLILDLDHFKRVNDTWGHPIGDEVLKKTAKITISTIRESDVAFRLGGEEFIVLMPQTGIDDAILIAEKIREAIEKEAYPITGKITASFGVAQKIEAESFNNWYKRVDEALYCAKEGGRNRVVSFEGKESLPVASVHFEWKNEWESGNENIDAQHREILELGNNLIYMSLSSEGVEKTINQLDKFLKHIISHFKEEEQILMKVGYPDYEVHSKIHKNLVEKALKFKESYKNGELKSSAIFSFMVDEVVIGHMLDSDMKFFSYTRGKDNVIQ